MNRSLCKRIIASLTAVSIVLSMAACGSKNETAQETTTASSAAEITDASEDNTTAENIFNENYDPLADDYDPYSGEAAATITDISAVTEKITDTDTQSEAAETTAQTTAETVKETTAAPQTTASPSTEAPASSESKSSEDVELIISTPNGWNDGTNDFSQLDGTIRNNGKTNVESWTATITAASGTAVEQSWNCELTVKNGTITVKPVEHNKSIAPGGEGTFGFILKNPGTIDSSKASLSCSTGTYSASDNNGNNNNNNNSNNSGGSKPSAPVYSKDVPPPTTDDWLSVKGNKIIDKNGKQVWLTGVNWFGYNTGTNTFDGLWTCDLNTSLAAIADRGFNLLRVPISAELINNWSAGYYPTANYNQATNSYLNGMNSLEIFDYVVGQCRANGLKIMIDIHSAKTDSMGHMKNVWYEGDISEQDYLDALSWMADRYKNDDTIIAYDLKNEPHGKANESPRAKWDNSKDSDNWKYIAEKAAKAVLDKNPNALVMVEGIEIYPKDISSNGNFTSSNPGDYYSTWWGGNLRGVKDNPVDLGKYQNKLVYSPHDYGPAVYQQEWFKGDYTYESLYNEAWYDNWFYIQDTNTAPLLIGEWGGFMTQPNLKWMTYLRQLIKEHRINHTFWCFNANSGDTGGLVKDDFTTWDEEKYEFVKEVLWQEGGKFVGLDHEIPLGSNGKTLS